jgi:hypothetical protein
LLATLDDVVDEFGSARTLAVEVLGLPEFGGHATKPVVRALGELLHHPLGPAVAAETLAVLASAADVVDTSMVLATLDRALRKEFACRPRRLELRHQVAELVGSARTRTERIDVLCDLVGSEPSFDVSNSCMDFYWSVRADRSCHFDDEMAAAWLRGVSAEFSADSFFADHRDDLLDAFAALDWPERLEVAGNPALFSEGERLLPHVLVSHTRQVLTNPACPGELLERIRCPYDQATLELAVRAGSGVTSLLLVRRQFQRLTDDELCDLATQLPLSTVRMLRRVGLLSTDLFLSGALSDLDLTDVDILREVVRPADLDDWYSSVPDHWDSLSTLLRELGQSEQFEAAASCVIQEVYWSGNPVPVWVAAEARAAGYRRLADVCEERVDLSGLTVDDAPLARSMGDRVRAACPGIEAVHRPLPERPRLAGLTSPVLERFTYPDWLQLCHGQYLPGAPQWSIHLFRRTKDLKRNATRMQNCTADYADAMHAGDMFIVAVVHDDGQVLNAELAPGRGSWNVGQVNSFGNEYDVDPDVRPALKVLLDSMSRPADDDPWESLQSPSRTCSVRRDRRRERSSAARRRRR